MRSIPGRGAAVLISVVMLITFASAPVSAVTVQRTWTSQVGWSGANGTITLYAYTNGVGSIRYGLKGLKAGATYTVQIRSGTCAKLGSVVAGPPSVRASATGTVTQVNNVFSALMTRIWTAARSPGFVVRIVSGTSIRCGAFSFAHATRVAVSGLGIDLPVIRGTSAYPACRVAMYLAPLAQPREPGVTFIYAHARTGMFLPLLTRWRISRGASLIGRTVTVWTSDSYATYYRITKVRVTTSPMVGAFGLTSERLWLQTSTGPNYTYPKLIVEASRYKTVRASYAASHPVARPVSC